MTANLYKKFITLVQKWPVDPSRKGRDLGENLRLFVAKEFPQGPITRVDESKLKGIFNSLHRLSTNYHQEKYPRAFPATTATGLDKDQLREATSIEFIKIFNESTLENSVWSIIRKK